MKKILTFLRPVDRIALAAGLAGAIGPVLPVDLHRPADVLGSGLPAVHALAGRGF